MITTANDLHINSEYYICLVQNGRAFLCRFLERRQELNRVDFYFKYLERKGFKETVSYFGIEEIGLGLTKEEARSNYGKLTED